MDTKFATLTLFVVALLFGFWFYEARFSTSSSTFAGPSFHSTGEGSTAAVYSDLSLYIESLGFQPTTSPSGFDSWVGGGSVGSERFCFLRKESKDQSNYIYVDLNKFAVRTSLKWDVYGTDRKVRAAEAQAYTIALNLAEWFDQHHGENALFEKERKEMKLDFIHHIEKNK